VNIDKKFPYKIAVLGASGVGKTYFFASYFYATRHARMSRKYSAPSIQKGQSESLVRSLEKKLFSQHTFPGTDSIQDISFVIKELNNATVELFDLPGRYTTSSESDAFNNIVNFSLKDATGIMIFFRAPDVYYTTTLERSTAFDEHVRHYANLLKELPNSKQRGIAVPVYFIFTQGDRLGSDQINEQDLLKHIGSNADELCSLVEKISDQPPKLFLIKALGRWNGKNYTTPPDSRSYSPTNVVEAMESMFDDMLKARKNANNKGYFRHIKNFIPHFKTFGTVAKICGIAGLVKLTKSLTAHDSRSIDNEK
jgi:GTPase SAR1 family protein